MQLSPAANPITSVFPKWSAALTLVKEHGTSAVSHAAAATRASDGAARLDSAIRAMTSLDHAIDNVRELPVTWFTPGAGRYLAGYEAAKQAVTLLVASGAVPHAAERLGRGTIAAARESFDAGVGMTRADRSRFGGALATGWLDASVEDVATGSLLLRGESSAARDLSAGVRQIRTAAGRRQGLDESLVARVAQLFSAVAADFDRLTDAAPAPALDARRSAEVFSEVDRLLAIAGATAQQILTDAPALDAVAKD